MITKVYKTDIKRKRDFHFQKDATDMLFPVASTTYTWKLWLFYFKKSTRRLWKQGGEEDWLKDPRNWERHGGKFPGFSFFLTYPRLVAGERSQQSKTINGYTQNSTKKSLFSLPKGQEKGQLSKTLNITALLEPNSTGENKNKNCSRNTTLTRKGCPGSLNSTAKFPLSFIMQQHGGISQIQS